MSIFHRKTLLEHYNQKQINDEGYPWYMRLIPTSIFWQHMVQRPATPTYLRTDTVLDAYIKANLGESCNVVPKDASLISKNKKLVLAPSKDGGTCTLLDVKKALSSINPVIAMDEKVVIPVKVIAPNVSNETAQTLATRLNKRIGTQVSMKVRDVQQMVSANEIMQWLVFTPKEAELVTSINKEKATVYFAKEVTPKVAIPAGVTKVTTQDFTEIARVDGANGQTLNTDQTIAEFIDFLEEKRNDVTAVPVAVGPRIDYVRTYTATSNGITALMTHYAQARSGVFGVSFVELSGAGRSAEYNSGKRFITASTYKLFVAYGTLKKAESGEWKWSDQIAGGRDMAACFDDMIVKSDNACAEALLKKYGYNNLTNDIRGLGLTSSGFGTDSPYSTPNNLALFLTKLEGSQLGLKPESRDKLLGAMKRTVHRQGIPAGATGQVASKVGFLDGLLHDAAIVYSPSGTYVLVIMTDGSSWANIAELTRQIEALRVQ